MAIVAGEVAARVFYWHVTRKNHYYDVMCCVVHYWLARGAGGGYTNSIDHAPAEGERGAGTEEKWRGGVLSYKAPGVSGYLGYYHSTYPVVVFSLGCYHTRYLWVVFIEGGRGGVGRF